MKIQGKISYSSPSNIAILKYWGKQAGNQIPMNPSLSMTLEKCRSNTTIDYQLGEAKGTHVEVTFEGDRDRAIEAKLKKWFIEISRFYPWLNDASLQIETHNNFPHSAGIASSASGMSAMAMCLAGMNAHASKSQGIFLEQVSQISRLGSGSASRSVMGPWVLWGKTDKYKASSDEYAVLVPGVHADMQQLQDTIIVVDKNPKSISSRDGHGLMDGHPWREGRIRQAHDNLADLLHALQTGDWPLFQKITENEALSLHALMFASKGGMMLWKGNTVEWMHYLRQQREVLGLPMAFTLDAGANIHLLYPLSVRDKVHQVLEHSPVPSISFIHDSAGQGPDKVRDEVFHQE